MQLKREPTTEELAAALGMDLVELDAYQMLAQPRQVVSLDEISERQQGDDQLSLTERIPDPYAITPDAAIIASENKRLVIRCMYVLPKTQGTLVDLHYLQGIPLREIAEFLVVTPSRVSQLHHEALKRMRQAWKRVEGVV